MCSAAKLCHFVTHGGQVILPSELAELVLADWTGSVPPMPSAGQSLFLTAHHREGSNHTGSNWDSVKSSPASDISRYVFFLPVLCGLSCNGTATQLPALHSCLHKGVTQSLHTPLSQQGCVVDEKKTAILAAKLKVQDQEQCQNRLLA